MARDTQMDINYYHSSLSISWD